MKYLVVANWKMNPTTLKEAQLLFAGIKKGIRKIKDVCSKGSRRDFFQVGVVICPPFVYLSEIGKEKLEIKLGAQDCFWEEKGAYTGQISPTMLKNLGCEYVILGHSEKRKLGERDEVINKKLKAVHKTKLKPILCIGETEKEKKEGKTFRVLKIQLKKAINHLTSQSLTRLIVAYEPVWAIGTGNPCLPQEAKNVLIFLRKILKKNRILYGGSVNSQNAKDYIKTGFDGLLVGGASLDAKEFSKIIKNINTFR